MDIKNQESFNPIPTHIAIIMDGNGRWAKKRGLPRSMGHRQGAKIIGDVIKHCVKIGVKYLTLYAFSTENWNRPADEVNGIMDLLREYLSQADRYKDENIRSRFIGSRQGLAEDIVKEMERLEEESKHHDGFTITIAINYGGREEITNSVKEIAKQVESGELSAESVTQELVEKYLYTEFQPDPDLVIRPSGEQRLSNFLLWQIAYAEFVFMDVLWPDFKSKDLDRAIAEYSARNRRFGGI